MPFEFRTKNNLDIAMCKINVIWHLIRVFHESWRVNVLQPTLDIL